MFSWMKPNKERERDVNCGIINIGITDVCAKATNCNYGTERKEWQCT